MPKIHLKHPRFTYSARGPFTKSKERIKICIQTGNKILFIGMIWIKPVVNMIWLILTTKVWLKEQNLIKF